MKETVKALQDQTFHLIDGMKAVDPAIRTVRIGVVAYRDLNDKKRFEILPFTDERDRIRDFVTSLQASFNEGANTKDIPEDVFGAYDQTLKLDWNTAITNARIMIHIADAPPHGTYYQPDDFKERDCFSKGDPHGLTHDNLMPRFQALGIDIAIGQINFCQSTLIKRCQKVYERCRSFALPRK